MRILVMYLLCEADLAHRSLQLQVLGYFCVIFEELWIQESLVEMTEISNVHIFVSKFWK